jgi:hypothetical protein
MGTWILVILVHSINTFKSARNLRQTDEKKREAEKAHLAEGNNLI